MRGILRRETRRRRAGAAPWAPFHHATSPSLSPVHEPGSKNNVCPHRHVWQLQRNGKGVTVEKEGKKEEIYAISDKDKLTNVDLVIFGPMPDRRKAGAKRHNADNTEAASSARPPPKVAKSAEKGPAPVRKAFLICNWKYVANTKLEGAEADGESMAEALTRCGYEVTLYHNLRKESSSDQEPERKSKDNVVIYQDTDVESFMHDLRSALDTQEKEGRTDTRIVVYFAGHGGTEKNGVLGLELVDDNTIGVNKFVQHAKKQLVGDSIFLGIFDTCRDPAQRGKEKDEGEVSSLEKPVLDRGNCMLMFSTTLGKKADDGVPKRGTHYTNSLAKSLQPEKSLIELALDTHGQFKLATKGKSKQVPWIETNLSRALTL